MSTVSEPNTTRPARWVAWTGIIAIAGSLLWMAVPWVQTAVLGDRPSVATGLNALSLVGWASMAIGLVGFHVVFNADFRRIGRIGVGLTGVGMILVDGLLLRSVSTSVRAGFRGLLRADAPPTGALTPQRAETRPLDGVPEADEE